MSKVPNAETRAAMEESRAMMRANRWGAPMTRCADDLAQWAGIGHSTLHRTAFIDGWYRGYGYALARPIWAGCSRRAWRQVFAYNRAEDDSTSKNLKKRVPGLFLNPDLHDPVVWAAWGRFVQVNESDVDMLALNAKRQKAYDPKKYDGKPYSYFRYLIKRAVRNV